MTNLFFIHNQAWWTKHYAGSEYFYLADDQDDMGALM